MYVDLYFHASSLPCLHTFWHVIPTSSYIFNAFLSLVSEELATKQRVTNFIQQHSFLKKACKLPQFVHRVCRLQPSSGKNRALMHVPFLFVTKIL